MLCFDGESGTCTTEMSNSHPSAAGKFQLQLSVDSVCILEAALLGDP